jgi:D-alanyl-D-alanine carboxypeptidase/D-alanyl-D-alanine-endopeptidase (penicillin-binding protein 4)
MLKKMKLAFLACSILLIQPVSTKAAQPPLNAKAEAAINALGLNKATHGVYAIDARTGRVLISLNADKPLNPASNAKMVTTAVALSNLGRDYRFHTIFSTDRMSRTGTIGNLYIKGNGDPFFVTEMVEKAVIGLISSGVRKVSGDIIVDQGFFAEDEHSEINNHRAYAAGTAATALNFNSVNIIVDRKGNGYEIKLDAPNDYVDIENKLRPVGRGVYVKRVAENEHDKIVVSGGLPRRHRHFEKYLNITHPSKYLGSAFKTALIENGVPVEGTYREGKASGTIMLFDHQSKPLFEIVEDMNRFSNNFIAEQITKHIGALAYGKPGTTDKGIKEFEKYLNRLGIKPGSYVLVNGSGLSYDNRMTSRQLVTVLKASYDDPSIRNEYINSLSIAGQKGTIKSRHKGPLLNGKLRGKTGTLNDVSTLTGFLPMANGDTAIFAIQTNGPAGWGKCHKLQDKIATMLASY